MGKDEKMNEPVYCKFCRRVTHTKENVCTTCGRSKSANVKETQKTEKEKL